jgi:hypothetical protein
MTSWTLHLVNARHQLRPCADVIRGACAEAEARIRAVTDPLTLDIVASAASQMPEALYSTGHCYEPGVIGLRIGITQLQPEDALHTDLLKVLFHEFHHALRWEGPGYGTTLGEALVSEGLAQHFLHEMMDCPPEPFEHAVPEEVTTAYHRHALALFDDADYDHDAWFFGSGPLPNWLGYTLGKRMVDRLLAERPGETALGLVHLEAEAFRATLAEKA